MNKACPLVLRKNNSQFEFLAFQHPLAGNQIVKGSIEAVESLEAACERELFEESGLTAKASSRLGIWHSNFDGQVWGFCVMTLANKPQEGWEHFCLDDNGHVFKFFWQALHEPLDESWHPVFKKAIEFVRNNYSPHLTISN